MLLRFYSAHLSWKTLYDEFQYQGDAKRIVIRMQLRGHNDTPFGRPTPDRPIGPPVVGCPQGVYGSLSYYQSVIFFSNIVPLIMEFTLSNDPKLCLIISN
jgi:hypothetical protein